MAWPLLVYFAFVVILVTAVIGVSYLLGQRHSEPATGEPYEGGTASEGHHYLNATQLNGVYHFGNTIAMTGAFFTTTGTADSLLYAAAPVTGSANGSPASTGAIGQISYWPQQNIQFTAQYTGYTRFNGRDNNYDGSKRGASDNNNLYLQLMFVF